MNLKNYTSSVPAMNSIQRIEFKLAQAGATHIAKTYEDEKPIGIIFQIPINDVPMTFKLPAKTEKVYDYMRMQRRKSPTKSQAEALKLQAERTGWKILSDWIDLQISMIQIQHVEVMEIFLPYLYDGKSNKTLFEKMKTNNFKLLSN